MPQQGMGQGESEFDQMDSKQLSSAFSQAIRGGQNYEIETIPENKSNFPSSSSSGRDEMMKEPKDEIEKLIFKLKSKDPFDRSDASSRIVEQKLQDGRLIDPLIDALNDMDWNIRKEAAISLGNLRSRKAVSFLLKKLEHEDEAVVRINIIESLGKIKDKNAIGKLMNLLKTDMDDGVRRQIILTIGEIGDDSVVMQISESSDDHSSGVRMALAEVLGQFSDIRTIDVIQKLTKDKATGVASIAQKSYNRLKASMA
jgi:HEAT repeat protein